MNRMQKRAGGLGAALLAAALVLGNGLVPPDAHARYVRNTTRTNVNANVNRNRNVNVNRNHNVHRDIDVDVDRNYHPVARTAGFVAATAVTAAAIGSIVHTLPPACSATVINGFTYQNCDGTLYQPRYAGTQVNYVVVNPPY
jgi:hypothetical protein